jgi:hypothetical protein
VWECALDATCHSYQPCGGGDCLSNVQCNGGPAATMTGTPPTATATQTATVTPTATLPPHRCGQTVSFLNGAAGGYDWANVWCQIAADTPDAHLCSTAEVLSTIATLDFAPDDFGWIAGGGPGAIVAGAFSADCLGYTQGTDRYYGSVWIYDVHGGMGLVASCDNAIPYLCCCTK